MDEMKNGIAEFDSRKIVGYTLEKLYRKNKKVVSVYADVGSRFSAVGIMGENELEVGIAEQSLVSILGGMAHEGFIPFGIAYAPFITARAADQIRMTIGEMAMNVKLIGGSAGLVSGNLGAASLALDDVAMMRAIPNVAIMSPSDGLFEARLIEMAAEINQPVYLRLTGGRLPPIYEKEPDLIFGKGFEIYKAGRDAVIYSTGAVTNNVLKAAKLLEKDAINITVVDMPFIKPVDTDIIKTYSDIKFAFTVEEHNIVGGLGSAVAEYIAEYGDQKVIRLGVKDSYLYPDTYESLLAYCGLDPEGISKSVRQYMKSGEK